MSARSLTQRWDNSVKGLDIRQEARAGYHMASMHRTRIAFLAGPADGPKIYADWKSVQQRDYVGTNYLEQFLQLVDDVDADAYVVTWSGTTRSKVRRGRFTFDNRPLTSRSGLLYYIAHLWWHFKLLPVIRRFKPDVLVLTGNQNFWWTLWPVRAELLPSFHCVLWPTVGRTRFSVRFLLRLESIMFRRFKLAVVTSRAIEKQLRTVSEARIIRHLPTYSPRQFNGITPPRWSQPLRVIFAARIEANKGVFDVLEIARQLPDVQFDVCGTGGALERARSRAPANVCFHGFCNQVQMNRLMSSAHLAVVPTRSDFEAGFEMTAAEAILSGRPLVTSAVCPALDYLRPASIEAEPDNPASYANAIRSLDRKRYERLCAACEPLKAQFYDPSNSWLTAMKNALAQFGWN